MLISADSDVSLKFWGMREYEGVRFFIESETELPQICPFSKPSRLPCPHQGLNENNYRIWKPRLFQVGNPDLELLFPDNSLKISQELTFVNAGYLPPRRRMDLLFSLTNAVPLIIYGLKSSHEYQKVFEMARSSVIRPVYIYGAADIPVPNDFRE